jgi:hypothetical protein
MQGGHIERGSELISLVFITGPTLGEEEDLSGCSRTVRRQVQSARPPGVYDQEIDPSIWNAQVREKVVKSRHQVRCAGIAWKV